MKDLKKIIKLLFIPIGILLLLYIVGIKINISVGIALAVFLCCISQVLIEAKKMNYILIFVVLVIMCAGIEWYIGDNNICIFIICMGSLLTIRGLILLFKKNTKRVVNNDNEK